MSSRARSTSNWDARIARARSLAPDNQPAREALMFYAALAGRQRSLFIGATQRPAAASFADAIDLDRACAVIPEFLAWLAENSPAPLAVAAGVMSAEPTDWRAEFRASLEGNDTSIPDPDSTNAMSAARRFVIDAVLQPFAEAAALDWCEDHGRGHEPAPPGASTSRCPICSDLPCVGSLREEGQGAKRMLACARCLMEWEFLRGVCPSCGEERFDALPVYTADLFPHVRIDACDTCHVYLKTIDLTKDGLAVPLVDDLASLPLDLWATETGYRRLRVNLLQVAT